MIGNPIYVPSWRRFGYRREKRKGKKKKNLPEKPTYYIEQGQFETTPPFLCATAGRLSSTRYAGNKKTKTKTNKKPKLQSAFSPISPDRHMQ